MRKETAKLISVAITIELHEIKCMQSKHPLDKDHAPCSMARLKDTAFPAKCWRVFSITALEVRISSLSALNLTSSPPGSKKTCRTESQINPRKVMNVEGENGHLLRLIKYPASLMIAIKATKNRRKNCPGFEIEDHAKL